MELSFTRAMAKHRDSHFAAHAAGYAFPQVAGAALMRKPAIAEAVREATQRFLYDHAGSIAISVLAEIATDKRMPSGARVKSATELAKLSNIAISDDAAGKADHEMTAAELGELRRKLEAQRLAVESVLDSMPRETIEAASIFD